MRSVQINFYTRAGCHLCDQAWQVLEELAVDLPLRLQSIDVRSDPELENRYGEHVPVATTRGRELFRHHANPVTLREVLSRIAETQ